MLEKVLELTKLFDFYGELLTSRQKSILTMYLSEDLGLAEIAQNIGISRQAVYDHIHKSTTLLFDYERKLGLASRFSTRRIKLLEITQYLNTIAKDYPELELKAIVECLNEVISL